VPLGPFKGVLFCLLKLLDFKREREGKAAAVPFVDVIKSCAGPLAQQHCVVEPEPRSLALGIIPHLPADAAELSKIYLAQLIVVPIQNAVGDAD